MMQGIIKNKAPSRFHFSVQTQISFFEMPCEFLHLQSVPANTLGFSLKDFTT
jgi:hypothetical protein